jgi:hypothetical protein
MRTRRSLQSFECGKSRWVAPVQGLEGPLAVAAQRPELPPATRETPAVPELGNDQMTNSGHPQLETEPAHMAPRQGASAVPGMAAYRETERHLNGLALTLLQELSALTPAARELIAAHVSFRPLCWGSENRPWHPGVSRGLRACESGYQGHGILWAARETSRPLGGASVWLIDRILGGSPNFSPALFEHRYPVAPCRTRPKNHPPLIECFRLTE